MNILRFASNDMDIAMFWYYLLFTIIVILQTLWKLSSN